MARTIGVSVCGIMIMMMMMMIMGAAAQAPAPSVDCESVVLTLSDCLGFLTGTDKTPSAACCNELLAVVESTPQCLCLLINPTFTDPLGVNITRVQELPLACKVQTPSTSLCAFVGPAPAASKAPSPALAPASLPTAPSPSASSPTASPPSPTTAAPGGSVLPSTNIESPPLPSHSPSLSVGIGTGISVAGLLIVGIALFMCIKYKRRKQGLDAPCSPAANPPHADERLLPLHGSEGIMGHIGKQPGDYREASSQVLGPQSFSYEQLSIATKNFNHSELLGAGGFGLVYRGLLAEDGTLVAVKCISEESSQGETEFKAEVTIISDLRHRNLVRLRGWCHNQGKFLLVYDYMPNGSLDYFLFNDERCDKLSWERRYSIACGLGAALQYLHEECDNVIIHRDIKSSNVLLDERFNAKLGDFGLARQVEQGMSTIHTTRVSGTSGYMAPECLLKYGKATKGSDVYAFGAVLLELVCGKHVIDARLAQHEGVLVDWVWDLHSQGKVMEAVDERLAGRYDNEEARRMLLVGLLCSHPDFKARPKIRRAMDALLATIALPSMPSSKPTLTFGTPISPPMSISSTVSSQILSSSSSNPHPHASFDYNRLVR